MSTSKSVPEVLEANKAWAKDISAKDPQYFEKMATGQTPDYLWIGCSDSRIPPNTLLNLPPGAVFVHRNIGNLFGLKDLSSMAVVEFAVSHLKVKHVILCGHTNCGAVAGSLKFPPEALGTVNLWISELKDTAHVHSAALEEKHDDKAKFDKLAELSVVRSVYNLVNSPPVVGAWMKGEPLTVHGMIFRIETGLLEEVVTVTSQEEAKNFSF
jgi:carbonic anhydrase